MRQERTRVLRAYKLPQNGVAYLETSTAAKGLRMFWVTMYYPRGIFGTDNCRSPYQALRKFRQDFPPGMQLTKLPITRPCAHLHKETTE